jgi:hypothetical protein
MPAHYLLSFKKDQQLPFLACPGGQCLLPPPPITMELGNGSMVVVHPVPKKADIMMNIASFFI